MKLIGIGTEVTSVLKWNGAWMLVNAGLLLIVFAQMAESNHCERNLYDAFFRPGALVLLLGCLVMAYVVISEWIIPLSMKLWRWFDE